MLGGELNPSPIQLLVNYWEIHPHLVGSRLDDLVRKGVTHIVSFVPWQAVETDISQTLPRFLEAVSERRMTISLILSPEVGVHFSNSGLPKDVLAKPENLARNFKNGQVLSTAPPNLFALPSLYAPEFSKRYYNFLSRMDGVFSDLAKNEPQVLDGVTAILTGSFWKYYRAPQTSAFSAFGGPAGDYSASGGVAYRQGVDQFYSQREFSTPDPMAANRWKTSAFEEVNRKWFYQQSEDVFRARSSQLVKRKSRGLALRHIELFTPEADPSFTYSGLLQSLAGGNADFSRLNQILDEMASRASYAGEAPAPSYVHWTSIAGFQTLSDAEKQFLILKSLLLFGAHGGVGGGLLIDVEEWMSLSDSFRARTEAMVRALSNGELRLPNKVTYFAPHLWSTAGTLWEELSRRAGPWARMVSSAEMVLRDTESSLLVVDPSCVLTRELVEKLSAWSRSGRCVVLPNSPLLSDSAREALGEITGASGPNGHAQGMEIDLGVRYKIFKQGEGKLIVYDLPEGLGRGNYAPMHGELAGAWQRFLTGVMAISGVQEISHVTGRVSDPKLTLIPVAKKDGGYGIFILNGTSRPVSGDLLFAQEVLVSDLARSFSTKRGARGEAPAVPAKRFALEVPPFGVLPLGIEPSNQAAANMAAGARTQYANQRASLDH